MEEGEVYLGGFYSRLQLTLGTFQVGAGIYATTKRLFLSQENFDLDLNQMITGSARSDFKAASLTSEQNNQVIMQISMRTPPQLVFRKEQISSLELKMPPGVFRTGYLRIIDISGRPMKLGIGKKPEFEYVRWLLQLFKPEALRAV